MNHDDNVRAFLQRETIAGLLIPAVTKVVCMRVGCHVWQRPGQRQRVVTAGVINDHDTIHNALSHDLVVRPAQRADGIVSRHDDHDLLAIYHKAHSCR